MGDLKTMTWRNMPHMQAPRSGCAVAPLGDLLYAMGGSSGQECLDSAERFNPKNKSAKTAWELVAPMSCRRDVPAAAVIGNTLYVCGGYDGQNYLSSMESFTIFGGT